MVEVVKLFYYIYFIYISFECCYVIWEGGIRVLISRVRFDGFFKFNSCRSFLFKGFEMKGVAFILVVIRVD